MKRFFRVIDRGILEHHSRPGGLPLMLAALPEYHAPFRQVSNNPYLMKDGITKNPDPLRIEELGSEAWRIVEPLYLDRLSKLVNNYRTAKSRQLGSDDLAQIAIAAKGGRVDTLLIEVDREVPGLIHPDTARFRRLH